KPANMFVSAICTRSVTPGCRDTLAGGEGRSFAITASGICRTQIPRVFRLAGGSTFTRSASPRVSSGVIKRHRATTSMSTCGSITLNETKSSVDAERLQALPRLPRDEGAPVFAEPWEAQAFALAVKLSEQGHFTWKEWAAALAAELKAAADRGEPDDGSRHYHHLLPAPGRPRAPPRTQPSVGGRLPTYTARKAGGAGQQNPNRRLILMISA